MFHHHQRPFLSDATVLADYALTKRQRLLRGKGREEDRMGGEGHLPYEILNMPLSTVYREIQKPVQV